MNKLTRFLIPSILLLTIVLRLHGLTNPIGDWHSWRQADTSAVSRNFVKFGFDLMHPRFDDLSNVPSGLDNPQGYRFVEFPLYNAMQAGSYLLFGVFTLEEWGRLITIGTQVLSVLFLYLIAKKHADEKAALLTALFYAILPYNIYYGRTILPDPSMVMAVLGGIYFFDKWLDQTAPGKKHVVATEQRKYLYGYYLTAIIFTASAFLLKPYALFFVLPMLVLAYARFGWKLLLRWELWLFAVLSVTPLALWRMWITQYPEGIPVSAWLFNGGNYRFKPFYFNWIYHLRLSKLILGYSGLVLFGAGIYAVTKAKKIYSSSPYGSWFFFSFLLSSLAYVTVIARGNVQHDYYQIIVIPSIALFLGIGTAYLLQLRFFTLPIRMALVMLVTGIMIWVGWSQIKDYFNINNRAMIAAGIAVDRLTEKNAKVLAPLDGDTSFLYQTKRQGWASFEKPLPELIKMGAGYLILLNPTPDNYTLGKTYKIIASTSQYIIFDLKHQP